MTRKLVALACAALLAIPAFAQQAPDSAIDYRSVGAPLRPFRFVTAAGRAITPADAPKEDNFFVMMFNPTCDHCQEAARLLGKHDAEFKDGQLVLVATPNQLLNLELFENVTKVSQHPKFAVALDSSGFIDRTFAYRGLPQLSIYNRERQLIRYFVGDVSMDSVRLYLGPNARQATGAAAGVGETGATKTGRR